MKKEIKIFDNPDEIAISIADKLTGKINFSKKNEDKFFIALSGGSTPNILFKKLSQAPYKNNISWEKVHLFWVDERMVDPGDEESNYGSVGKILLKNIKIPSQNIHRIKGENNLLNEVKRYGEDIINSIEKFNNNLPIFDWIFLGMGSDGHTASIFPNKNLQNIYKNICGVSYHPKTGQPRISLTEEIINNGKNISFMVTGSEKSGSLKAIFEEYNLKNLPAGRINAVNGKLEWLLDTEAAKFLK
jgi:6-phosphogluconolactonase